MKELLTKSVCSLKCYISLLHRGGINTLSMYRDVKIAFIIMSLACCYFTHKKSVTLISS